MENTQIFEMADRLKTLQEQKKDRHTEEVEALYSCFYNIDLLNYFP